MYLPRYFKDFGLQALGGRKDLGRIKHTKEVHPTNFIHLELCVSSINHASLKAKTPCRPLLLLPKESGTKQLRTCCFLHIKVIVKHVQPHACQHGACTTCGSNAVPHSQNVEMSKLTSKPDTSESFSVDGGGGSWSC